jgi:hypothetical protein
MHASQTHPYYGATTLRLLLPSLAVALSLLLPACHAQTPVAQSGPAASSAAATATAPPACVATGETGDPFADLQLRPLPGSAIDLVCPL